MLRSFDNYTGGRTPREILLGQAAGQNSVAAQFVGEPCELVSPAQLATQMAADIHITHNLVTIQVVDADEASVYFELTGKVLPPRQYATSQ